MRAEIKDTVHIKRACYISEGRGIEINIEFRGIEIKERDSVEKSVTNLVASVTEMLAKINTC